MAGALTLSALGDALGLPNEARGLAGEVSPLVDWALPVADSFREPDSNPWNIWASPAVTAGMRGVVSDDTAVRIVLIEPWIADARGRGVDPTEADWREWLRHRRPEAVEWREAMALASTDQWLAMYAAADLGRSAAFYQPGVPVCFGPFLFLQLALIGVPIECALDQGEGVAATNELHTLVGAALAGSDAKRHTSHAASPDAALAALSETYHGPDAPTHALKPFDTALQLAQVSACLEHAGDDPLLAVRLAASGPGDTDTLAAMVGMIVGARLGREALLAGAAGDAVRTVEATTARLYDRTIDDRVAALLGR